MSGPVKKGLMKNWFAVEAVPIYVIMTFAVGGAAWYVSRLARGPDVVWTHNNPQPWNTIKQDENAKLYDTQGKFNKSWSRDKL